MKGEIKNVIVTGATGAIGGEIASQISGMDGFALILIARNEKKLNDLYERFISIENRKNFRFEIADLSRKQDIYNLAEKIKDPIHVLVNNAAAAPHDREFTEDGLEVQFATNIMSYFWMTLAFRPHLKKALGARIVNVASYWAGDLELDDLQFNRRKYNNNIAYRQSKQANRMNSTYFASLLHGDLITVNACHPGDVGSKLSYNLGFSGSENASKAAETPVWLATDKALKNVSGKWFEYKNECPCRFSEDGKSMESLFNICMEYSGGNL